jgi:ATP-dependent RNA helicase HelY
VKNYSREEAHRLLNSSFGQFQADRAVRQQTRQLTRDRALQEKYLAKAECDLGDFREYWQLRQEAEDLRRRATRRNERARRDTVRDAVAALRPGDVVYVPRASRKGIAVVLSSRDGRPTLLTQDRKFFRASANLFQDPPEPLARIPIPRSGSARSARYRRDLAARLATLDVKAPKPKRQGVDKEALERAEELDRRARAHPCHRCPDRGEHEKWAAKASKLEREVRGIEQRIRARTETLGRQFDRVLKVLDQLGYVDGFRLTQRGEQLARIYGDGDVVVAEMLATKLLQDLSAAEVAALVSTLVYESRERTPRVSELPTADLVARYRRLDELWRHVRKAEEANQVELTRELETGFGATAFHWAEGKSLEDVLLDTEMAPGDFVRTCKQLLDMLRQIEEVAGDEQGDAARGARMAVNRGVVAYTGV